MAPDGETITFDTYSKCAEAMNDGRADAVTTDNVILIGLIDQSPDDFELVDNPFTEEPYGIGVPDGSDMRCWINEVCRWPTTTVRGRLPTSPPSAPPGRRRRSPRHSTTRAAEPTASGWRARARHPGTT